jgi:ABC-type sugar transport system substrate-binding protein
MRKVLLAAVFVTTLLAASAASAQNPNYDVGPVWRVTYFHIKPGQGDAFWKDLRENTKVVLEEFKKAGYITDYKVFLNPTVDRPDDWDVAVGVLYPNWAALDQLDAKGATIAAKHYGSRDAMLDAAKKRNDYRDVIASHLAREVTAK